MNIPVTEALLVNVMQILDKDNDNEISMEEFEAVFAKYLSPGGAVQVKTAEEYEDIV